MCSWCWGYRPVWDELQTKLPEGVEVEFVCGGLASDSDEPMSKELQNMIQRHWYTIAEKLGTKFDFNFWQKNTPYRSTYNACRAVLAAKKQDCELEMIDAIQRGYYLRALNPSDRGVLIFLAEELAANVNNFDLIMFCRDFKSAEIEQELQAQILLARQLTNQGFPSLVLEINNERHMIQLDYIKLEISLSDIKNKLGVN